MVEAKTSEFHKDPLPSHEDSGEKNEDTVAVHRLSDQRPTNEYVLNVAWISFLLFTAVQFFFSIIAKSEAMMTDCAAMMVDVVTYLFNFLAEHHKHGSPRMSARQLRLHRLYLELIPPMISVTTLIAVTVMALEAAFKTLVNKNDTPEGQPVVSIMFLFSGLNLLLDILNVHCFARVDQAVGLPSSFTPEKHLVPKAADEATPLLVRQDSDPHSDDSTEATGVLNLNMCSAWTHVCADTLRSVAVLIAAGVSSLFPQFLTPAEADSDAAIVVSVIILVSLIPLIRGLFLTACKIYAMWFDEDHSERSMRDQKGAAVPFEV